MSIKKIAIQAAILLAFISTFSTKAQVAIKSNLLLDTTTPNLGIELGVGQKNTLNITYGINPWKFNSKSKGERKANFWVLMPEYRWWTCSRYNGIFFGVHALGGQINAANVDLPIPGVFLSGENLHKSLKDYRYQGWYAGAGLTFGYQWILSHHWNFEAAIGAGYAHAWLDKFPCAKCGTKTGNKEANYMGVTKSVLSILYIF